MFDDNDQLVVHSVDEHMDTSGVGSTSWKGKSGKGTRVKGRKRKWDMHEEYSSDTSGGAKNADLCDDNSDDDASLDLRSRHKICISR